MPAVSDSAAYQLKITLREIRPPIWRRLLVSPDSTLADLHHIIQIAFDWEDYHLHVFSVDDEEFGEPTGDDWTEVQDERRVRLRQILKNPRDSIDYTYDFGDSWEHRIVLEKIHTAPPEQPLPACLDGARAGPPEDSGGPWGYQELLEALREPEHPEHAEYLEWTGGEFDPEHFDRDAVNAALRAVRRPDT